mmetsp:Transcript_15453/g.27363  ORF Transcript_15453/g.27363 Transcript_15453/m.27363 type:complete len:212 (+) Transcript_15453:877-1512(+)
MELACAMFSLLDHKWDAAEASYMDFNRIMGETVTALVDNLERLPLGITPSAHSFSPPETDEYMILDDAGESEMLRAGTLTGADLGADTSSASLNRRGPLVQFKEGRDEEGEDEDDEALTDVSSATSEDEGEYDGGGSRRVAAAAWGAYEDAQEDEEDEEEDEEPLLDLAQFEECEPVHPQYTTLYAIAGMGTEKRAALTEVDFFESFGISA